MLLPELPTAWASGHEPVSRELVEATSVLVVPVVAREEILGTIAFGVSSGRRYGPADLAMAGLRGGSLAFAASFFVISIACDYRYLYLVDMAAVTGVLYLALDPAISRPTERRRGRR